MEAYVLEDILEVGAGEGRRTKGCAGSAADEPRGSAGACCGGGSSPARRQSHREAEGWMGAHSRA